VPAACGCFVSPTSILLSTASLSQFSYRRQLRTDDRLSFHSMRRRTIFLRTARLRRPPHVVHVVLALTRSHCSPDAMGRLSTAVTARTRSCGRTSIRPSCICISRDRACGVQRTCICLLDLAFAAEVHAMRQTATAGQSAHS
jgi:hypothetical protein